MILHLPHGPLPLGLLFGSSSSLPPLDTGVLWGSALPPLPTSSSISHLGDLTWLQGPKYCAYADDSQMCICSSDLSDLLIQLLTGNCHLDIKRHLELPELNPLHTRPSLSFLQSVKMVTPSFLLLSQKS